MKHFYVPDFCKFFVFAIFFHKKPKTDMISLFSIILLDGLSVMKLVWSKNNAFTNYRGVR